VAWPGFEARIAMNSRATPYSLRSLMGPTLPARTRRDSLVRGNGRRVKKTAGALAAAVFIDQRRSGHVAGHKIPVDQVPERIQVLRAGVAVIDVVGVLPDVYGH
jgi:hypothetical protein